MNEGQLPQGPVGISEYQSLIETELFRSLQAFSESFLDETHSILLPYRQRWVADPLHQWSRQWEYPFVFSEIRHFLRAQRVANPGILDAGSGITFFPYFLDAQFEKARVCCCDIDPSLQALFSAVDRVRDEKIEFRRGDLRRIPWPSDSFDLIYCISVLEHTQNHDDIIREFERLLRPSGRLVVTIDISLDGRGDISLDRAKDLLRRLQTVLVATDPRCLARIIETNWRPPEDSVSTQWAGKQTRALLPWRFPTLTAVLRDLRRGRFPKFAMRNVTFSCHVFEKAGP